MLISLQFSKLQRDLFYFGVPPLVIGSEIEKEAALRKLAGVEAQCAARVFIPRARMKEFVQVLTANVAQDPFGTNI